MKWFIRACKESCLKVLQVVIHSRWKVFLNLSTVAWEFNHYVLTSLLHANVRKTTKCVGRYGESGQGDIELTLHLMRTRQDLLGAENATFCHCAIIVYIPFTFLWVLIQYSILEELFVCNLPHVGRELKTHTGSCTNNFNEIGRFDHLWWEQKVQNIA